MNPPHRPDKSAAYPLELIGQGAGVRLASSVVIALASISTTAIGVRLLGVSDYGLIAFPLAVITLLGGLSTVAITNSLAQSSSSLLAREEVGRLVPLVRGAQLMAHITFPVALLVLGPMMLVFGSSHPLSVRLTTAFGIAVFFVGTTHGAIATALARGTGRVFAMEGPHLISSIGRMLVLAIVALLAIRRPEYIALGFGAVGIVVWLWSSMVTREIVPLSARATEKRGALRSTLEAFGPFAAVAFAGTVISRLDVAVLGLVGTSRNIGVYEATVRFMEQVVLVAPLLAHATFLPAASTLLAGGERQRFSDLYVLISKVIFIATVPALIMLLAFHEATLQTIYGQGFPVDIAIIWSLLCGYGINIAFGLNVAALMATGHKQAVIHVGLATVGVSLLLCVSLIPAFGAYGAAISSTGGHITLNLAAAYWLRRITGAHPFRRGLPAILGSSLLPMAMAVAIEQWRAPIRILEAIAWVLVLWVIWVITLRRTGYLSWTEVRHLFTGRDRSFGASL